MRQMTSYHARMCLLRSRKQILYYDPIPPKTEILGPFLTGVRKFRVKYILTTGMLICKLLLIVIVPP